MQNGRPRYYPTVRLLTSILLTSFVLACGGAPDDIREANEASETGATAESGNRTGFGADFGAIPIFDLQVGDCFNSSPNIAELYEVLLVPCDGFWEFRVLNRLPLDDLEEWPGEAYFIEQISTRCDPETVSAFYPSEDSWFLGDRSFVCLAEQ